VQPCLMPDLRVEHFQSSTIEYDGAHMFSLYGLYHVLEVLFYS
jgi:hypothetical protein